MVVGIMAACAIVAGIVFFLTSDMDLTGAPPRQDKSRIPFVGDR